MSTATQPTLGPWTPLRVRIFRWLWLSALVSNIGTSMHTVGAAWAITDLTTNPAIISLVQTAWAIPGVLVAVPSGALADVVDRRRLIIASQIGSLLFAAALGVLAVTDRLDVPLLLLGTFLLSVVMTLSGPAFMALIPDLVGPDELTQAIGLNNIAYNGSQSVGPALAGVVIAAAGPGAVFLLNAVSFLGIWYVMWRYRPARPGPTSNEPLMAAMKTGVTYFVQRRELIRYPVRIAASFFCTSAAVALLPSLARHQLHTTAGQFGILSASFGVGAVVAVWLLPKLKAFMSSDMLVVSAATVWAVGATAMALTHHLPVAAVGVLCTGIGQMSAINIIYSLFMLQLPSWIRGRASSVVMLSVWTGMSIGAVVWGAVAGSRTLGTALLTAAVLHLIASSLLANRLRLHEPPVADSVA
jgi:MFS family permease